MTDVDMYDIRIHAVTYQKQLDQIVLTYGGNKTKQYPLEAI